ncbi:uncharacterized protein TNCV_4214681 [Trichonephila clavipes]|nr:uncharacterized protein TNCV_4214681 [Trichonephila clavipes]
MEQEVALKLWQRSEDSGFRYTTLLSDGDAKTYQYLNTKEVYGPEIKIKKEECINHVSKRLGLSLRKAVKEWRARGVSLGGKSRGRLKEETIKKLSRYYQNAIRSNKGEAALARGEVPGSHAKHVKTPLKETHLAKIMPIYQRLASNELLQRCIRCVTQNANESLHSIIWGKCSKETSATLRRLTIAVCDAVCEFNFGTKKSLENLQKENGLASNKHSKMLAVWGDYRRVYQRKRKRLAVWQVIYSQFGLAIHQNDHEARRRFVEWAQNEIAVVPDFHKRILFSDEAHFWLNGYVNKQNCRIWSEANPQVYVETPLHPEKLTVWCALWTGGIIGPYFKNDEGHNVTVNGDRYRAMITNFFIPELNNHDLQELWFQQDGATCHTARATIDLLKDTFGDRLISRFGPVNWPPRSCDLTPLDYFLWGYVKSLVYVDEP